MTESHRGEIAKLEALYTANPGGRIFTHLAEAYRRVGELDRARATVEEGLGRHGEYPSAHVVHGRVLADLGDVNAAEGAFRRVLELDPENRVALRALGDLAWMEERVDDALDRYRTLQLLDPGDEEVEELVRMVEAARGEDAVADQPAEPARITDLSVGEEPVESSEEWALDIEPTSQAEAANGVLDAEEVVDLTDEILATPGDLDPLDDFAGLDGLEDVATPDPLALELEGAGAGAVDDAETLDGFMSLEMDIETTTPDGDDTLLSTTSLDLESAASLDAEGLDLESHGGPLDVDPAPGLEQPLDSDAVDAVDTIAGLEAFDAFETEDLGPDEDLPGFDEAIIPFEEPAVDTRAMVDLEVGAAGEAELQEVDLGDAEFGEVGLGEVELEGADLGAADLGEVGLGEVGLGEVGLGEVGLGEVGLGEVPAFGAEVPKEGAGDDAELVLDSPDMALSEPVEAEPADLELGGADPAMAEPVAELEPAELELDELELDEEAVAVGEPVVELELGEEAVATAEPVELEAAEEVEVAAEPAELELGEVDLAVAEPVELELGEADMAVAEPAELVLGEADVVVAEPVEAESVEIELGEADLVVTEPTAAPVVTQTMAELYARQGLHGAAAEIYRELLRTRPDDGMLRARLAEVEAEAANARVSGGGEGDGPGDGAPDVGGPSIGDYLRKLLEFVPATSGAVDSATEILVSAPVPATAEDFGMFADDPAEPSGDEPDEYDLLFASGGMEPSDRPEPGVDSAAEPLEQEPPAPEPSAQEPSASDPFGAEAEASPAGDDDVEMFRAWLQNLKR